MTMSMSCFCSRIARKGMSCGTRASKSALLKRLSLFSSLLRMALSPRFATHSVNHANPLDTMGFQQPARQE